MVLWIILIRMSPKLCLWKKPSSSRRSVSNTFQNGNQVRPSFHASFILFSLLALMVGGCNSTPRVDSQEVASSWIPEKFNIENEPEEDLSIDWIRDFNDPELEDLIRKTLADNPDRKAANARLEAAWETVRIVGADRMPQAQAQALGSRGRTVNRLDLPVFGDTLQRRTASRYELGVNVSWELDLWGRIADQRRAALSEAEAAEANLIGTELALSTSLTRAWFQAIAAKKRVEIAKGQLMAAEKSLKATENRLKRGLLGALELSLARSQKRTAQAILETRISEEETALRMVQSLTGSYPDGYLAIPNELPKLSSPPPPYLPSSLLSRRPDLIAASRQIEAADARLSAAEKRLIPTLSLTGNVGTASEDLSDLLNRNFSVWNLAGNLIQPLYQGGLLRADISRQEALLLEAIAQFESNLITAFREVEDGLNNDAFLRNAQQHATEATREADIAARQGFDRFLRGLLDLLDVLELQNRSFDSQLREVDTHLAMVINRVDLYAAMGGGFSVPAEIFSDTEISDFDPSNNIPYEFTTLIK